MGGRGRGGAPNLDEDEEGPGKSIWDIEAGAKGEEGSAGDGLVTRPPTTRASVSALMMMLSTGCSCASARASCGGGCGDCREDEGGAAAVGGRGEGAEVVSFRMH